MSEVFDQLELLRKLLRFEIMISLMLQLNFTFGIWDSVFERSICGMVHVVILAIDLKLQLVFVLFRCLIIQQLLLRNFSFLGNFDAITIFN